jgi:hypothetical protein
LLLSVVDAVRQKPHRSRHPNAAILSNPPYCRLKM